MSPLEPVLFVADPHIPYHDAKAWRLMLRAAKALKPSVIVSLGDFVDFYAVSSHSKSPDRKGALVDEVEIAKRHLDELDGLGATRKFYVSGNHEDRLARYIRDKAPELFGLRAVSIPGILDLRERGWVYVPYKTETRVGKLRCTHDVGVAGRYSVFKALDTFQHSVATAHAHRLAYIVEGNAAGEQKLSVQFGWLGDAEAIDYMHRFNVMKNWALGFGIGYLHPKTGIVYCVPVPIVKHDRRYSCVVNGTLYEEG